MNELAPPTPSSIRTLKDLSAAFLANETDRQYSPCTLRNHRCTLNAFIGWLAAREVMTVDLVLKEHLELWIRHLNAHRTKRGQPLQPQSINLHIVGVKQFLDYLAVRGFVPGHLPNALQCVKAPSLLPQSVLTHAQVRAFLLGLQTGTLEGCRNRAMLELLYSSGLRASELLGLDVLNVNLTHATAVVTGKGRKQRVVPFGRTALSCLESYPRTRPRLEP
jgi:site-specific recombinase XerD